MARVLAGLIAATLVSWVFALTSTQRAQAVSLGTISTVVDSSGDGGFAGDGGPARSALVDAAQGLVFDGVGNLVLSDTNNNRIRVVAARTGSFFGIQMTSGNIYTIAGSGAQGYSGDRGSAVAASFHLPQGVSLDSAGNVVVADTNNNVVRVIAARSGINYGISMTAGDVYTVAGTGASAFSGDGGPGIAAAFSNLQAAEPDPSGNLLIADASNDRIRVLAARTGTFYGLAMTAGDVYTIAGNGRDAFGASAIPATSSGIGNPTMALSDRNGNVVLNGYLDQRILVVAERTGTFYGTAMTAGDIYSVAGNGSVGSSTNGVAAANAQFSYPNGLALDTSGNIVVPDLFNNEVRVVAEKTGTFYGVSMSANSVYTIAGATNRYFSSGDGGPAAAGGVDEPGTVAIDGNGNLYVAEMDEPTPPQQPVKGTQGSSRIRKITP